MCKKIIDGICKKLSEEFNKDYKIYTENVKQGFTEPCFFVQLLNSSNINELGNRFYRKYFFCIQYFPANKEEPNDECNFVYEKLSYLLEYIEIEEGKQRGVNIHGSISEGVLSFFINYSLFVLKTEEKPEEMKELEINKTKAKGNIV